MQSDGELLVASLMPSLAGLLPHQLYNCLADPRGGTHCVGQPLKFCLMRLKLTQPQWNGSCSALWLDTVLVLFLRAMR